MRKVAVAVGAAFLFAVGSGGAFAEELSGVISGIDADLGSVTIDSGEIFYVVEDVDLSALEIGQSVIIGFEDGDDGELIAMSIIPAN